MKLNNAKHIKTIIAGIVGRENVTDNRAQLNKNSTDATGIRASPLLITYPKNKWDVLEIIKLANEKKIPVVTRGGGSGLCGGATADKAIVLNMTKMNRIIRIYKKQRQVLTQPGIILDNLNKKLEKDGIFFPVQPASHKIATIGGMISTNAGGEHVLRFGKMNDNIIEMEIVTGNGKLLTVKKRKIAHFCGTEGLFGVVVEAKLRVSATIKKKSITVHEAENVKKLMVFVNKAIRDRNILAAEFINPQIYNMLGRGQKYFLLLEYNGQGGEIENKEQIKKYWKIREGCFKLLFRQGWKLISDPQIPIERVGRFLLWCEKNRLPAFGHIGHGIVHAHFKNDAQMDAAYKMVRELRGAISGEHGFGIVKKRYLPENIRRKLKKLKLLYDSKNILNPGKVI